MQHSPINLAIIFIAALLIQSEAKRGCALYGHSCYGGHGKRSEMSRTDLLPMESGNHIPTNKMFSAVNKEVIYPINTDINRLNQLDASNENNWKSKSDIGYAVYNLLRRWMDEAKKANDETQKTPEMDTIFKNNFV